MAGQDKFKDCISGELVWKYGYSVPEIAVIVGCTENAAWQLLARGLRKMRRIGIKRKINQEENL